MRKLPNWLIRGLVLLILATGVPLLVWALGWSGDSERTSTIGRSSNEIATTGEGSGQGSSSTPSSPGGPGDVGQIEDSVEYIIRDKKGKVKEHKTVGK